MKLVALPITLLAFMPTMASAETRDYCPDRPGIGTPPCTMASGSTSIEVGIGDWTHNHTSSGKEDDLVLGSVLVRHGVANHAEVQLGWDGFGFTRQRDFASGQTTHDRGSGDMSLALRRNLIHPDGSGFSAAVMPYVSLPVGDSAIGAGDWGAGMRIPLSYEISDAVSIATTLEIDAAVDADGNGRHLAYGEVIGTSWKLSDHISVGAEYEIRADHDPGGHQVTHLGGLSVAWMAKDALQIDAGVNAGLDRDTNDVEIYFGVARRF